MKKLKTGLIITGVLFLTIFIMIAIPENRKEIKSQHFTFQFSSSIDSTKISELTNTLESNYLKVGNDLKTKPDDNIETNIYAQRWSYVNSTKNWVG